MDQGLMEHPPYLLAANPGWPPMDIDTAVRLLRDATARGWLVSWRAYDPTRDAAAAYDPPGPVSTGVVKAHDEHRTITATGVTPDNAVQQIRAFFNWPDTNATTGDTA